MKKTFFLIVFCFQLLHSAAENVHWTKLEKDVFELALCRVDIYQKDQTKEFDLFKKNICKLKKELNIIVYEKYMCVISPRALSNNEYMCEQYKNFLLSTCLTYYLLRYFTKFYSEKNIPEEDFNTFKRDPFFIDFFSELIESLDFMEYQKEGWQFSLIQAPGNKGIASYMPYLDNFSFFIFANIYLCHLWEDSFLDLYVKMKKLFCIIYSEKSTQNFLIVEKELSQKIDDDYDIKRSKGKEKARRRSNSLE